MSVTQITAEIFASLATQTQSLIDEIAGRDYASALASAQRLLGNINAGAATLAHEVGVNVQVLQERAQAAQQRLEEAKANLPNAPYPPEQKPPTGEESPEAPPETEEPPPDEIPPETEEVPPDEQLPPDQRAKLPTIDEINDEDEDALADHNDVDHPNYGKKHKGKK